MPSIKPFPATANLGITSNPIKVSLIPSAVSTTEEIEQIGLDYIIKCAIDKYEWCESDDYNKDEFIEYIKNIYVPETDECIFKLNIDSLKDNYFYYFLNMLREYDYDSPLSNNRNETLRQIMYKVDYTSTPYIEFPSGKKSFKPFVYAQFNKVKGYDQGYFIKFWNEKPQQCSIIIKISFNCYNELEICSVNIECEDGTVIESKDVNIFNHNNNEYSYLASSQVFYEEDKVIFSEIHKHAVKIKNNILCSSLNKRSTFNVKTGRAYIFPTINMYTKKKLSHTINSFRAINCVSNFIIDYESVASEEKTKEIGKYIQEHCGLNDIISFEEYYKEYSSITAHEISEACYGAKDRHFRVLLAYNANPYVPFDKYKSSLEYIDMHKEHLQNCKYSKTKNVFQLKIPKKIRNVEFVNELAYNTFARNNFNDEDREILKQTSNSVYNYSDMYSLYKKFKNVLGENVDLIYENKEMVKESMYSICSFFLSDMMQEILKTYTIEEVFKSLRTIYISEKIKGASAKEKLREIFDMTFSYSRLQNLFDIRILKEKSLSLKNLNKKLLEVNDKYVRNAYDVCYHIDKYIIDEPDFKLEVRDVHFSSLYCMDNLESLPLRIQQKRKVTPERKRRALFDLTSPLSKNGIDTDFIELKDLPNYKIYNKKYQKRVDKFFEYYSDKKNIKFDLYKDKKLMEYKEALYI